MSARNYAQTLGAGQTAVLPAGVFFFVRTASAALDITTEGNPGAPLVFTGIGAGAKFGPLAPDQAWRTLKVYSATAQNIEIVISDDAAFEVASTVTVSGSVTTVDSPSVAVSTPAAVGVGSPAASTIAANLSRKRITIQAPAANTGVLYVQAVGAGAGRGLELQPGTFIEVRTTAALDVRNDSGASQNYTVFEET